MEKFSEQYVKTENMEEADGILVRSAAMHDMELPAGLLAIARAVRESITFRWTNVRRRVSWCSTRPAPTRTV